MKELKCVKCEHVRVGENEALDEYIYCALNRLEEEKRLIIWKRHLKEGKYASLYSHLYKDDGVPEWCEREDILEARNKAIVERMRKVKVAKLAAFLPIRSLTSMFQTLMFIIKTNYYYQCWRRKSRGDLADCNEKQMTAYTKAFCIKNNITEYDIMHMDSEAYSVFRNTLFKKEGR